MITSMQDSGRPRSGLDGRRVAVYEGDPFAKLAIESALRRAGSDVVQITAEKIDAAALALGQYSAAIVGPIVSDLKRRGVKYVLYAGRHGDLEALQREWLTDTITPRPASPTIIVEAVTALLDGQSLSCGEAPSKEQPSDLLQGECVPDHAKHLVAHAEFSGRRIGRPGRRNA